MYSSKCVANYFLDLGDEDGVEITPLQLQKLVYIAHGYHLAQIGKPLINETVEAWKYGPVIPALYSEFSYVGAKPILGRALEETIPNLKNFGLPMDERLESIDVVLQVWQKYKRFSALELSAMTHEAGSPWYVTRSKFKNRFKQNPPIEDETIREFYKKLEHG